MSEANLLLIVTAGFVIACISQALKLVTLSDQHAYELRLHSVVANSLSGGLGYFSYAMLLMAFWGEGATKEILLGTAAVIGWIGGNIFLALGRFIQDKFGIPLGIPPEDEEEE